MIQFACYINTPSLVSPSPGSLQSHSQTHFSKKSTLNQTKKPPPSSHFFLLFSLHPTGSNFLPSSLYIHIMMDEKIKIRLPNAREKLQPLFPDDNRGDIKIQFGKKSFKLQKAFLRLESAFFKRTFSTTNQILEIKQDFNETYFANILKCFYGFTVEISRSEILEYYPIIKFLQVQSLLKILREDMTTKSECYDVFVLLQIAHRFDQQQLFENCLAQLQKESYEQLRYAKHELLRCPMELFKMIIKTHNRLKSQKNKGIQFMEIDQIIKEFSEEKKLSEPQYQELKFQLIDKKSLSSQEYKEIFIVDAKKKGAEYRSMVKLSPQSGALYNSSFNNNLFSASKLTESVIEPIKKLNDELALELENTYEKKKNEELQAENAYLSNELKELKVKFGDHSSSLESLKEVVARLQARLDEKDRVDKQQTNIIKKLEKTCQQLRNDLNSRNDIIKKLQDRISKLQKQPEKRMSGNPKYIPYDEEQDESKTIQSQIVPGHLLKEIAKPAADALNPPANSGGFKKAKQSTPTVVAEAKIQEELDEDQIEEMYSSRLEFDKEPVGCNKRLLPKLANFLTTDGFQKKKLRLVFRRVLNTAEPSVGSPSDIRNRNSLLFLICTRLNQVIGGFTSVEITKNSHDYLSDQNAFIFSLSKDQRFNIKKTQIHQAIFISPNYLFGFSNDIMINTDCLLPNSCECAWPDAYECNGSKRSPKWLTGQQGSFSLKCLQIYEVKEEEMIMDL